jgi:hypothetical protein
VRLTGAVSTSFDEVNNAVFFAAKGSIGSNRKGGDYFQQRTTIQLIDGVKLLPTNVVMLTDQKQDEEVSWKEIATGSLIDFAKRRIEGAHIRYRLVCGRFR